MAELTGEELLTLLNSVIEDEWTSAATSPGASGGGTIVDERLREQGTDALRGQWVRVTSGANQHAERLVIGNGSNTLTVSPPFAAQVADADRYGLHRWSPQAKFRALDRARRIAFPRLSRVHRDETLFGDGERREFDLPPTLRTGPFSIVEEVPLASRQEWNLLRSPVGDSTAGWGWGSSVGTANIVSRSPSDREIPKYDQGCTRLSYPGAADYGQVLDTMAPGRRLSFWAWVYSRHADAVFLRITDGSGNTQSNLHQGEGWELLRVRRDVAHNNSRNIQVDVGSSEAMVAYWNRAWAAYGDPPDIYTGRRHRYRVVRSGQHRRLLLDYPPARGHQLRITGRDVLSPLGADPATQGSSTMELDADAGEVLATLAAQELFTGLGMAVDSQPRLAVRVGAARSRLEELGGEFDYALPYDPGIRGPWGA